jgi:hypothetical protein
MSIILDIAHCPVSVIFCRSSLKLVETIKKFLLQMQQLLSADDIITITY